MALKIQIREKLCVEWKVVIPRVGRFIKSPDFILEGVSWYFKMISIRNPYGCGEEDWSMVLEKQDQKEKPKQFMVTTHVRSKENEYLFMNYETITDCRTTIWHHGHTSFLSKYLEVDLDRNTLTFVVTFNFDIRNSKDIPPIVREHKSAQTSPYLDDRLCLGSLSLDLGTLMEEGSNPDVQLKCGDCILPVHKLILGARSEVFRTMLQSDMVEGKEGSVEIVDMQPKVFEIFVRYIYTGILPELTEDIASPLYEAGDKYNLEALRGKCGEFLAENLTRENACTILTMADAHSDKDLKNRVMSYIVENKIPCNVEEWPTFCDDHPKLANEVLNRAYKQFVLI